MVDYLKVRKIPQHSLNYKQIVHHINAHLITYNQNQKQNISSGKYIIDTEIFEEKYLKGVLNPVFVYGFPIDVSPLARRNNDNPMIADRFELFVNEKEIANAFSELNDPEDQFDRFNKQLELKSKGDDEASDMDEDYINALRFGMPPTAGAGLGIDRLVMLLTDSPSIREVILFPHMRNE